MTIGSEIEALDFNAIRADVLSILGPGTGQRGYGQAIASSPIFSGNNITAAQWDLLKLDLINIKLHQTGVVPPISSVVAGDVVRYSAGSPNYNYRSLIDQAMLAKFNLGTGQSTVSAGTTVSSSASWSTQSQCTITVTFNTTDQARYFFNSGGRLRFSSSRTGGSLTQQNNAWSTLLNTTVGMIQFGAQIPETVNFYSLTNSYQQVYQASSSTPYSLNYYQIEALCNCTDANNINGTASAITFRITWRDNYVDPGAGGPSDLVDGTLSVTVDELKASGAMLPSGTFTITSPTYSSSSIVALSVAPPTPAPTPPPPAPTPVTFTTSISPTSGSSSVPYAFPQTTGNTFSTTFVVSCSSGSGTVNMTATPFASFASCSCSPSSFSLSAGQTRTVTFSGSAPPTSLTNPWTFTASAGSGGSYTYTINRV